MCWWRKKLRITTRSLVPGTVGVRYWQRLSASGGSGALTWSVSGLPDGLRLATDTLTGIPRKAGRSEVRLEVRDMSNTATVTLTLVVADGLEVTVPSTIPEAYVGSAYSLQLTISGGLAPYTVAATGLPTGLSIDDTGLISGTPTTAGTASVTVTVTDAA